MLQIGKLAFSTTCTRCGICSEFFVEVIQDTFHAILCSDCCLDYIQFANSIGQIREVDIADYAKETTSI